MLTCKRASWILWTPMGSAPLVSGRRVLLLPAVQYGGHAPVFPLDWQQGPLLGFVTVQGADPKVLAYAEYIRMHLMPRENFWTPLR